MLSFLLAAVFFFCALCFTIQMVDRYRYARRGLFREARRELAYAMNPAFIGSMVLAIQSWRLGHIGFMQGCLGLAACCVFLRLALEWGKMRRRSPR
jgi:hypothetical protein